MKASALVSNRPGRSLTVADRAARGLGWFSIGLGITELIAPGRLAQALGLNGREKLVRAYGLREIASGVGALSIDPAPAIWSRVAGDLVDLGTLAVGGRNGDGAIRKNAGMAITAVLGVTLIDLLTATSLQLQGREEKGVVRDYSDRSGFPKGVQQARGRARDFDTPPDMRAELPLAPRPRELETP